MIYFHLPSFVYGVIAVIIAARLFVPYTDHYEKPNTPSAIQCVDGEPVIDMY